MLTDIRKQIEETQNALLVLNGLSKKQELDLTLPERIPAELVIQNRSRKSKSSILQMQAIAQNPKFDMMSEGAMIGNGAPVVAFGHIPKEQMGKKARAVIDAKSDPLASNYAVVDVNDIVTSNDINGNDNKAFYSDDPSHIRAIAGNGRITALQEAYKTGKAEKYREEFIEDALSFGLKPATVKKVKCPVLVRVIQPKDVTADIGDKSNRQQQAGLSAIETARNDAGRLDLRLLPLDEDGDPTAEAAKEFIKAQPPEELPYLINEAGLPNEACYNRMENAIFLQAYDLKLDSGEDAADYFFNVKTDRTNNKANWVLANTLYKAAPSVLKLKGLTDNYDIRPAIIGAAVRLVGVRKQGGKVTVADEQNQLSILSHGDAAKEDMRKAEASLLGMFDRFSRNVSGGADMLRMIVSRVLSEHDLIHSAQGGFGFFEDDERPISEIVSSAIEGKMIRAPKEQEGGLFDCAYDFRSTHLIRRATLDDVGGLVEKSKAFWDSAAGGDFMERLISGCYQPGDMAIAIAENDPTASWSIREAARAIKAKRKAH